MDAIVNSQTLAGFVYYLIVFALFFGMLACLAEPGQE